MIIGRGHRDYRARSPLWCDTNAHAVVSAGVTDEIERGNGAVIVSDSFAVDNAGAREQAGQRVDDQWEAMGEIIAGTAVESHLRAVLAGNDAKAVVLDLMQPLAA